MLKIKEDVACIKSTVFVSVPRLYNKITEQLQGTINAMIKGNEAARAPTENAVFAKFREGFGGRIRIMLTGSAPINPSVQNYLQRAMGCSFLEGYRSEERV